MTSKAETVPTIAPAKAPYPPLVTDQKSRSKMPRNNILCPQRDRRMALKFHILFHREQ